MGYVLRIDEGRFTGQEEFRVQQDQAVDFVEEKAGMSAQNGDAQGYYIQIFNTYNATLSERLR